MKISLIIFSKGKNLSDISGIDCRQAVAKICLCFYVKQALFESILFFVYERSLLYKFCCIVLGVMDHFILKDGCLQENLVDVNLTESCFKKSDQERYLFPF